MLASSTDIKQSLYIVYLVQFKSLGPKQWKDRLGAI